MLSQPEVEDAAPSVARRLINASSCPEELAVGRSRTCDSALSTGLTMTAVKTLEEWLLSIKEEVVCMGFLGFQHGGGMLVRFAVLFRDRLDSWSRTPCWGHPHSADGRLELRHLHKVDVCGEGLIVQHKMRRLGIHAGTEQEARAWQRALEACARPIRGSGFGAGSARKATEQAASPDSQASTAADESPLRLSPPSTPSPDGKTGFRSPRLMKPGEVASSPQLRHRALSPPRSPSTPSAAGTPQLRPPGHRQMHGPGCAHKVGCRDVPSSPW